jgi:hypothetical protein
MAKDKKVAVSLNDWMDEYVENTAKAITQSLNSQADMIGDDHTRTLAVSLIATLIGTVLYKELKLKANTGKSRAEMSEEVMNRFADTKLLMQQAVSTGFETAMTKFTGQPIEYYCLIKTVPNAPSESVN